MAKQNMTTNQATTSPPNSNTTDSKEQVNPSDTISITTTKPKKGTEEPSTDIIDILIGNKRRRRQARGRSKRVSQVSPIPPTHHKSFW